MKRMLTFLLVIGLWFTAWSQEVQITDIRKEKYNPVKIIPNKSSKQAAGFYSFYIKDKIGKGRSNALLRLYDLKQNLISETQVVVTTHSEVNSVAFNGEAFLFAFKDTRRRILSIISVDAKGAVIASKELKVTMEFQNDIRVLPAQEGAFYIARPIKEKTVGYRLEKVDHGLTTLWEKQIMPDKGYIGLHAIETEGDQIIITQGKAPAFLSREVLGQIVCFNGTDGKEVFTHDLYDGTNTAIPTNFLIDKEKNIIAGGMYLKGQGWWNFLKFDGIFFLKIALSLILQ